ncbi:hypothetical protein Mapa_017733 [Marchantia paleacea]|nr:hypothetical protein Mapa_017733 [Marchantia paleacea]
MSTCGRVVHTVRQVSGSAVKDAALPPSVPPVVDFSCRRSGGCCAMPFTSV